MRKIAVIEVKGGLGNQLFILNFIQYLENKNEIKEFDKDLFRNIKIIPVSEPKSILEHTLVKPVVPLNLNESDLIDAQKSLQIENNIKRNTTH